MGTGPLRFCTSVAIRAAEDRGARDTLVFPTSSCVHSAHDIFAIVSMAIWGVEGLRIKLSGSKCLSSPLGDPQAEIR